MDLACLVCVTLSIGAWFASAERHSVYWNSSNPRWVHLCSRWWNAGVVAWVPDQPLTVVFAGMCASSAERGSGLMFYSIEILRMCSPCAPLGPDTAHSLEPGLYVTTVTAKGSSVIWCYACVILLLKRAQKDLAPKPDGHQRAAKTEDCEQWTDSTLYLTASQRRRHSLIGENRLTSMNLASDVVCWVRTCVW